MISERITAGVSTAALLSPAWLPSLAKISETASIWLPILGAIFLLLQIAAKIITTQWRRKD